jgi:hypothetical protein
MKKLLPFVLLAFSAHGSEELLKKMSGCFAVSYRFVENGTNDVDIKGSFEKISADKAENGTLVFQHTGVLENQEFKHLREEWTSLPGNFWQQKVYGPTGTFRYECIGRFELGQMRCLAPAAPKPVRDRERKDYENLDRENTIQITDKGWVQMERNVKRNAEGLAVSREVGWVEYRKTEAASCNVTQ